MTKILDTGFENGACVGGYGFDSYGLTPNTAVTIDSGTAKHGSAALRCADRVAYVVKNIYSEVTTIRFYFKPNALPHVSSTSIIELNDNISGNTMQINLLTSGKLRPTIAGANGSNSSTTLVAGTGYWVDMRCDSTTSTWRIDYRILDASGAVLEAPAQFSQSGLVELRQHYLYLGPVAGSLTDTPDYSFDDVKATDSSADYPLGAGDSSTGDNLPAALLTPTPASWVDDPYTRLGNAVLFGETAFIGNGPNWPMLLTSETSAKANRPNYITHVSYNDVLAPPHVNMERGLINSSILGHQAWPIINCFGFGGSTNNWPAGGLADFTSGSMNSVLDAWIALWNTLPATPTLIRMFHEMNLSGTIYGASGGSHGGVNETTSSFIAAWQYIVTYVRARAPWMRFIWCPGGATVTGYAQWYPGDSYVDWCGTDIYTAGGLTPTTNFANWYAAFNPYTGTVSRKPAIVCETGVDAKTTSLSNRISCVQDYANFQTHFPGIPAMVFWDAATNNDPSSSYYPIQDIPAGWLAAYQSVVNGSPFNSVPTVANLSIPAPGAGCVFGAYAFPVRGGPTPMTNFTNTVLTRETQLNRKINIVNFFRPWDATTFTMDGEATTISGGRCPMISWPQRNSIPGDMTTGIMAGTYDTVIHNMAVAMKTLGNGVILRLFWEFNGNSTDYGTAGTSAANFVTIWRRIWTIMKGTQGQINALSPACSQTAVQASDVQFCWCSQHRADSNDIRWVDYYPGNTYVDIIGTDLYNNNPDTQYLADLITSGDFNSTSSNNNWYTTFSDGAYSGKPLMICEYGCREQNDPNLTGTPQPMTKPAWWAQALLDLKAYPNIRLSSLWDSFSNANDWRIDTDPTTFLGNAHLNATIGSSDLTITTQLNISGYPTNGIFLLKIDSELIKISSWTGNTFTVAQRGWFGTTATSHTSGTLARYQGTSTTGASFLAVKAFANDAYMNPSPTLPVRTSQTVLMNAAGAITVI